MSLTLIESSPGLQIKRDVNFSNLTLNCDPRLVVPDTVVNQNAGFLKPSIAGKIAVESDICDLDVKNLTVHGKLSSLGVHDIELCNIVCDGNFSVSAAGNITESAVTGIALASSGAANDVSLSSGRNITLGGGDITSTATGSITESAVTGIALTSSGAANDVSLSSW